MPGRRYGGFSIGGRYVRVSRRHQTRNNAGRSRGSGRPAGVVAPGSEVDVTWVVAAVAGIAVAAALMLITAAFGSPALDLSLIGGASMGLGTAVVLQVRRGEARRAWLDDHWKGQTPAVTLKGTLVDIEPPPIVPVALGAPVLIALLPDGFELTDYSQWVNWRGYFGLQRREVARATWEVVISESFPGVVGSGTKVVSLHVNLFFNTMMAVETAWADHFGAIWQRQVLEQVRFARARRDVGAPEGTSGGHERSPRKTHTDP